MDYLQKSIVEQTPIPVQPTVAPIRTRGIVIQLEQIQSLFDRQLAQVTDVFQGEASLAAAQAEELRLEAELALARESLRSVSGLEVGPLYSLSDGSSVPELEFNWTDIPGSAASH